MNPHLFCLLLLLAALPASADSLPPAKATALRSRFEARQRETRTWSAGFTQTVRMPGLRDPVVSQGTISYRAPDALRIDFTKPPAEFVLALGDRLFIQKTGKRLAEKSLGGDTAGKPFQSLLGLLQGRPGEDAESFEPAVTEGDGAYSIVLTKKAGAGLRLPRRITNVLSAASLQIREVVVELPNGGTISYAFRETSRNRPLEASFTLPVER